MKKKEILITLHGFLGHSSDFKFLEKYFQVIALSLPGHDLENKKLESKQEFFQKIRQIVLNLPSGKANFLGYSMGGRTLLEFCLQNKTLVKKLVLESSHLGLYFEKDRKLRLKSDQKINISKKGFRLFLDRWYQQALFKGMPELDQYQNMISKVLMHDPQKLNFCLNEFSLGRQPYLKNQLNKASFKHLYLYGQNDIAYKLRANNFKLAWEIPNASHNTHLMNPQKFADALRLFI